MLDSGLVGVGSAVASIASSTPDYAMKSIDSFTFTALLFSASSVSLPFFTSPVSLLFLALPASLLFLRSLDSPCSFLGFLSIFSCSVGSFSGLRVFFEEDLLFLDT